MGPYLALVFSMKIKGHPMTCLCRQRGEMEV